jgi:HrpA-like RNA helicase
MKTNIYSCALSFHIGRIVVETFRVDIISKSEANQRAGRAGRESPGIVYRLYTKREYQSMQEFNTPEIQRADLTAMFIMISAINGRHFEKAITSFHFFEKPTPLVI